VHSIEFHTVIKDGAIVIPAEHVPLLFGGATVIVVPDASRVASPNLIDQLLANPLRVPGFQPLTREETHAR
jgi:hypothetical protein